MKYYLTHRKAYNEYVQAKETLKEIADEQDILLARVMPKGSYGEHISGNPVNKVEEYVIAVERRHIKERMAAAEDIINAKEKLMMLAEKELRKSRDIYDLVYTAKWIDHKRPKDIYRELDLMGMNYSRSHIYEVIHRIRAQIERDF